MKFTRFSLRTLLITVAVASVLCALWFRVVGGTPSERRAAREVATEAVVKGQALYRKFEPGRIQTVSINPRTYRVHGIADGVKPLIVVVVQRCDGFEWEYIESDHTR